MELSWEWCHSHLWFLGTVYLFQAYQEYSKLRVCARHLDRCLKWQHADSCPPWASPVFDMLHHTPHSQPCTHRPSFGTKLSSLCSEKAFPKAGKQVLVSVVVAGSQSETWGNKNLPPALLSYRQVSSEGAQSGFIVLQLMKSMICLWKKSWSFQLLQSKSRLHFFLPKSSINTWGNAPGKLWVTWKYSATFKKGKAFFCAPI